MLNKFLIRRQLESKLKADYSFKNGHILGSLCSYPDKTAQKVFYKHIEKNLGDPGLFPKTQELESETISILCTWLGLKNGTGTFCTGGTEANILALWAARKKFHNKKRTVILPATAHFSFDKGADLLGLKLKTIDVDELMRVKIEDVKKAVDSDCCAVIGIAGTTGSGAIDDLESLNDIAAEHDLYFHIDAAFGGFVIPFLKEAGYETAVSSFNFSNLSSITIDPHKMGRAPIPGGAIIFKDSETASLVETRVHYLAGGKTIQKTIVGTRNGAAAAAVWTVLKILGKKGFIKMIKSRMELSWWFYDEIKSRNFLSPVHAPVCNICAFASRNYASHELAEILRKEGWKVSLFPDYIRIAVMPHTKKKHLKKFLISLDRLHR